MLLETKISNLKLRNFPFHFKVLAVSYLIAISFGYVYALKNVELVVGYSHNEIAKYYHGSSQAREEAPAKTGEEELSLDEIESLGSPQAVKPSLRKIVGTSHFHIFGIASFFFGITLLSLFTGLSSRFKSILIGSTFFAIIFDNVSFLITRNYGHQFAYLISFAGAALFLCFLVHLIAIVYEVFQKGEKVNS